MPLESSSWFVVELPSNVIQLSLGELAYVTAFGQVGSQLAVAVLVGATLPAGVGISKVHWDTEGCGNEPMLREFTAIVEGNGVSDVVSELGNDGFRRQQGCLLGKLCKSYQAAHSLIHSVNGMLVGIDNTVSFPVTDTASLIHYRRAVVDGYPVGYPTVVRRSTFVLGSPFLAKTQVLV